MPLSCVLAWLGVLAAMVFVSPAHSLELSDNLTRVLAEVEAAERKVSYSGRYTYEYGGTIDSFEILRVVIDGKEFKKTINLNGASREYVRVGRDIRCLTPSDHLLRGHYLNLRQGGVVNLRQSYELVLLGEGRVAGRKVTVLRLAPKDQHRYGYVLSIDTESGLIARVVTTEGENALERLQYVSLEILNGDVSRFLSSTELERIRARAQQTADNKDCMTNLQEGSPWRPGWIPGGFVLTDYNMTEHDGYMETYSDGVSIFSVFVDYSDKRNRWRALVRRGATVAWVGDLNVKNAAVNVAVVGEIPLVTAGKIAESLMYSSVGSRDH